MALSGIPRASCSLQDKKMEIRFQLNTSEIRLDVIISKCQAWGKSLPQRTKKKKDFCLEIQVASLFASVISK